MKISSILIFCLVTVHLLAVPVLSENPLVCDKIASYRISAALDPAQKTVMGKLALIWKNNTFTATQELYFHAYLNAFKNNKSTFHVESAADKMAQKRLQAMSKEDGWGYLEIISMKMDSQTDLKSSLTFVHPDDGNTADRTLFHVALPQPVNPGQSIEIVIEFLAKLPSRAPRVGFSGDFFFIAQWFPKIAVFSDSGWNAHQFHAHSEFFSDFGDYHVQISVPENYVVGSTGVLQDSTVRDGKKHLTFTQECVHDFAWTAFPGFRVATRQFQYSELPPVTMRLLYLPWNEKYVPRFFEATANTLKHFGLWYVPYPYSQITIVDTPFKSTAGGMEYPTLFTTEAEWLTAKNSLNPENLTVHVCGHQFWHGLIANNEFKYPWLDEGINSYADTRCLNAAYGLMWYGKSYLQKPGFGIPMAFSRVAIDQRSRRLARFIADMGKDSINRSSWDFLSGSSYHAHSYDKPALMLYTLEGYLGEEVFARVMKTYAKRFQFKHPTPEDFIATVNEASPEAMDWFFDQVLYKIGVLDYAVTDIDVEPVPALIGYSDAEHQNILTKPVKPDKMPPYRSEVTVRSLGQIEVPVEIKITFESGASVLEKWDGKGGWKRFSYTDQSPVSFVQVDPEQKIALDSNPGNNSRYSKSDAAAALKWSAKWLFWLQHLFEIFAFLS